ncbi:hypothetical protein PTSG_09817 [Salpingoeca rosetta]|uniref:PQ-loop repeat-containing protein 1 n=1 Tax=Salpingoeca rosetta (strain ATCC 50818 / BSB-021) TaxID=946362 RepID=F2UP50_SALR5|nr:uncharacterized protein PTSG_09817 [Salpingoeca rosetta]EGD79405.1 hypothetical protein PTSG_09817 [Salpingoeca rosetta]|eukprot:XP_004989174.1 hypothetical protein PTSG_09817 [Salpingoeca rosetta]
MVAVPAVVLWVVEVVSVLAISLGGVVPFVFQYINIRKTRSSKGFSTYVILELIAAYVLRICFWFGHPFETPLLVQCVTMIVALLFLQHACITYDAEHIASSGGSHFDGTIDLKTFWRWAHFKDYVTAVLLFAVVSGSATLIMIGVPAFVETVGLVSLLLEASLGLPQFVNNFKNKSTEGMSVAMVGCWLSGDIFKTTYFVLRSAPTQFFVCGLLQVGVDISILLQVVMYSRTSFTATSPSRATKVLHTPTKQLTRTTVMA